jgi:hypothetical protein
MKIWTNVNHVTLFKILRDKKAHYDIVIEYESPNPETILLGSVTILDFDNKTVSCSEIYPIKLSFDILKTL